jgi:hypothetical protein
MKGQWLASPYRYADKVPWNDGRWVLLAPDATGKLVPIGGALKTWNNGVIAFLCFESDQRDIRNPKDAEYRSRGNFTWGVSLRQALSRFKYRFPNPHEKLALIHEELVANF